MLQDCLYVTIEKFAILWDFKENVYYYFSFSVKYSGIFSAFLVVALLVGDYWKMIADKTISAVSTFFQHMMLVYDLI